jgi:hypothetical protein
MGRWIGRLRLDDREEYSSRISWDCGNAEDGTSHEGCYTHEFSIFADSCGHARPLGQSMAGVCSCVDSRRDLRDHTH